MTPVIDLVRRRYSCRAYRPQPISAELQVTLSHALAASGSGPFGTRGRFKLVAATAEDRSSLKGLGTYGFIKDAPGFIVGAIATGPKALEDYGYLLERAILRATDLGLGTCWLGGSFSRSSFAKKIALTSGEIMPAVASIGYAKDGNQTSDRIRRLMGSSSRLPPEVLFFADAFGKPVGESAMGAYADALEAVRWAPSASNKQPWRVVHDNGAWHFYLERTKGYGKGSLMHTLMRMADLQRVDLGIAMCHFELTARSLGLSGAWALARPSIAADGRDYVATWRPA